LKEQEAKELILEYRLYERFAKRPVTVLEISKSIIHLILFRHSFATHHLEQGTNLLVIQRLMGHSDLRNTLKYLHVQKLAIDMVVNPLDELEGVEGLCQK